MEIRTPKGKLFGTLEEKSYIVTTIDGHNVRQFPVAKSGCCLRYTAGRSPTEEIVIPPQQDLLNKDL